MDDIRPTNTDWKIVYIEKIIASKSCTAFDCNKIQIYDKPFSPTESGVCL